MDESTTIRSITCIYKIIFAMVILVFFFSNMVKVIFDVLDRKLHNMMKWGWVL